ncbi:MAG: MBL fold metallo-hydrolase [Candidatus Eremiobacteraeota bacterium]|nr:MBL fold metallo-hydrolase [Candidatus Eremiobacteraeota bacterium]
MSINLDVYVSPYKPIAASIPFWDSSKQATFPASSASLFTGENEAVLIDALLTTAEASRLCEWIRAKNKELTTIYITHGHGDHFFGLNTILDAFPDAKAVTLSEIVPFCEQQVSAAALAQWNASFPNQFAEHPIVPEAMQGAAIDLEGHEIRPIVVGQSDTAPSSVVHARDIDAVAGGDVAYNGIHCWLAFTDHEKREKWLAALDIIDSLKPKLLVAGHKDPNARDDDPQSILNATRTYIRDFDKAVSESATPQELVDTMMRSHRELGNPYTLWVAADAVKDQLGRRTVSA